MTERRKLELQLNTPTELELMYDEPVVGSSQYGEYFLYAVKSEGNEYAFFAPDDVHQELQTYKKGDKLIVTKLAAQRGTKLITKYVVESDVKTNKESKPTPEENGSLHGEEEEQYQTDKYYPIMLKSLQDSLRIQEEVGFVDMSSVVRIAITMFIQRSR